MKNFVLFLIILSLGHSSMAIYHYINDSLDKKVNPPDCAEDYRNEVISRIHFSR